MDPNWLAREPGSVGRPVGSEGAPDVAGDLAGGLAADVAREGVRRFGFQRARLEAMEPGIVDPPWQGSREVLGPELLVKVPPIPPAILLQSLLALWRPVRQPREEGGPAPEFGDGGRLAGHSACSLNQMGPLVHQFFFFLLLKDRP